MAVALVSTVRTDGPDGQRSAGAGVIDYWRQSSWPTGLVAVSCFCNLDGLSVLIYQQWRSSADARNASEGEGAALRAIGFEVDPPIEYDLYRTVRGSGVSDPPPLAECFPVAILAVEQDESGREKIDQMLAAEEAMAGTRREYPGGIAAHMHVSADDSSVFVLSEWVSAELQAAHAEGVWQELLAKNGHRALHEDASALGDRYWHYRTVSAVSRDVVASSAGSTHREFDQSEETNSDERDTLLT